MEAMAVLEKQQQFDFQNNGIEVMNFETLQRTYKENDIYGKPVQGIYHYQVLQRMMDICEKYNLDYEVEEIFAAQNRNKTQPGVSILPQVEQTLGEKAVEAHILRRIFATIRIKDWETDELTTTLVVAHYSIIIFGEILFYHLFLYIRYLQIFSFGLNTHKISRF